MAERQNGAVSTIAEGPPTGAVHHPSQVQDPFLHRAIDHSQPLKRCGDCELASHAAQSNARFARILYRPTVHQTLGSVSGGFQSAKEDRLPFIGRGKVNPVVLHGHIGLLFVLRGKDKIPPSV